MVSHPCADIFIDDYGHIRFNFKKNSLIELDVAKEFVGIIEDLAGNSKRGIILDARGTNISGDSNARKYIGKHPEALKWRKADVILFDSLPVRLVANFYMKYDSSSHPVRIFKDEQKALKWLGKFN